LIGRKLSVLNCKVIYADEDADVDIAKVGVSESLKKNTTVIGEDTDLLVLLLYYSTTDTRYNLYFRSDITRRRRENLTHDIIKYRKTLGHEFCSNLLFVHSFTGSDTTSAFYGVGKGTALHEFVKRTSFNDIAKVFTMPGTSHQEIEDAGEKAALIIYKSPENTIHVTRQRLLTQKVLKARSFVKPEMLPPTRSALKYHSFHCYYQIRKWCDEDLNAEQWGWINTQKTSTIQKPLINFPPLNFS
jgi:5'-3' exonuclease